MRLAMSDFIINNYWQIRKLKVRKVIKTQNRTWGSEEEEAEEEFV